MRKESEIIMSKIIELKSLQLGVRIQYASAHCSMGDNSITSGHPPLGVGAFGVRNWASSCESKKFSNGKKYEHSCAMGHMSQTPCQSKYSRLALATARLVETIALAASTACPSLVAQSKESNGCFDWVPKAACSNFAAFSTFPHDFVSLPRFENFWLFCKYRVCIKYLYQEDLNKGSGKKKK